MVPNLIWASDLFVPREIWVPYLLSFYVIFMWSPHFMDPKILGANISWGQNEIEDQFSYTLSN